MNSTTDKEILRLAVPNILSNISVPLLSTVDTILMGDLSSVHLAAVGLASMIFNIIYWNFGFLRMGTTGITAQYYGAEENDQIWISFVRACLLALLLAIILIVFKSPLYNLGAWALNVSNNASELVYQYYSIRIWAAPASLVLMAIMGWFFGLQNAIYPLILTVLINIVNIVLSYVLVVHYQWDVAGVAWGTVVAQYVGVLGGFGLIIWKYRDLVQVKILNKITEWKAYSKFMRVNFDLFLRTICLTFAFGFFYSQSSKISDTVLAVNVVLMQFVNWMSYGIDGFAYATESLVGKYKGAKNDVKLRNVIRRSFIMGALVSGLYALIYGVFGKLLFDLFTDDKALWSIARELMPYMIIFPIAAVASYIWDGIYVGLTATKSMRNAMILALVTFLLTYYSLPYSNIGAHIWQAMVIFMIARAVYQWYYYRRFGILMK